MTTLLGEADGTPGGFTSYRSRFAKGAVGAPAHFATKGATELFFVISASLRVLVGEEVVILNEGDFVVVSPHTPRAFARRQTPRRTSCSCSPRAWVVSTTCACSAG